MAGLRLFVVCLAVVVASCCYSPMGELSPLSPGAVPIFYGPNAGSGKAGEVMYGESTGEMCYIHGGIYDGSDVWSKVCLPRTDCCEVGYTPTYKYFCASGNCGVPYCSGNSDMPDFTFNEEQQMST
eukprot:TRINITY_DN673_c0_g2_i1.p4 TRINITY_DN673_c0_g2~~TRINITY_DN673_c0_g2_i1.p4  ORF type:complete len:126 (-),score=16.70 TRINITY_DN673_c0_g2_i1:229-606(-)